MSRRTACNRSCRTSRPAGNWSEDGKELTFPLHKGVKWHDGKPFTAADVKCTWDLLMGLGNDKLRVNPRKPWYSNVEAVTTSGDYEVTFHLTRPQASFLAMLATGWTPIYPCHVSPAQMRLHPIGTGPFKFVEFKPNEVIKVARNPDYWKPGRPYLAGIEWTIIKDVSTRLLAFIAGKTDLYPAVTIPQLKDVKKQMPQAVCEMYTANVSRTMIVNRSAPPFDNPDLRRAMSLTIDRKAFNDIINEGQGEIGAVMQPQPDGLWGMPPEMLQTLPGYDPDVAKNRAAARKIMEKLGYGPDKQEEEADRRAADFRKNRLPKYLGYFEQVLERNPAGDRHLAGDALSYADLSMFQVVAGLDFAFPRAMRRLSRRHPRLRALHDRIAERPRIAAYLASDRRIAFNQEGIFRHYPALDG